MNKSLCPECMRMEIARDGTERAIKKRNQNGDSILPFRQMADPGLSPVDI
jgi:hypothetical protein